MKFVENSKQMKVEICQSTVFTQSPPVSNNPRIPTHYLTFPVLMEFFRRSRILLCCPHYESWNADFVFSWKCLAGFVITVRWSRSVDLVGLESLLGLMSVGCQVRLFMCIFLLFDLIQKYFQMEILSLMIKENWWFKKNLWFKKIWWSPSLWCSKCHLKWKYESLMIQRSSMIPRPSMIQGNFNWKYGKSKSLL